MFGWIVFPLCRRVNGAPFDVGQAVIVLKGKRRGTVTTVYELTRGQGNQTVVRVELGSDCSANYNDLFEEYEVVRIDGA